MLALNRSLLNREYIRINILKALASIISMCNLHVILLSKITPRYFTLFTNGIFRPFNVRREWATILWYDTDGLENDASNNYSTIACIHC
jgi:hypothetical protein